MVASRVVEGVRLLYCHTLTLTKKPPRMVRARRLYRRRPRRRKRSRFRRRRVRLSRMKRISSTLTPWKSTVAVPVMTQELLSHHTQANSFLGSTLTDPRTTIQLQRRLLFTLKILLLLLIKVLIFQVLPLFTDSTPSVDVLLSRSNTSLIIKMTGHL